MSKVHNNESGYIAERYNPNRCGRKVVIYAVEGVKNSWRDEIDGWKRQRQLHDIAEKYAVVCKLHDNVIGATSVPRARTLMKTPATWCQGCGAVSCHTPSESAPGGKPAVIRFDKGNEYVHVGALLASLAIDPALGHSVMQAVEEHCRDIDNDLHNVNQRTAQ